MQHNQLYVANGCNKMACTYGIMELENKEKLGR